MRSSIALASTLALGAFAADSSTSVTSLFLGASVDGQNYAASVASVGSNTIYHLVCTSGVSCGATSITQTVTYGASNLNYEFVTTTMGQAVSASETCDLSGTTQAVCTADLTLSLAADGTTINTGLVTTTTLTGTEVAYVPVTLTAGVEKLASATQTGSASGSGSSSGSASGSASGSSASAASSGSGSGASSIIASGKGSEILKVVTLSAVAVSVGALMIL